MPSGNQTWQWTIPYIRIPYLVRWFSLNIMMYYAHWTTVLPLKKCGFPLGIGKSTICFHDFPTLHENIYEHMKTRMVSCHVWFPKGSEGYVDWRKAASFDPPAAPGPVPRPSASSRDSPARAAAPAILQTSSEPAAAKATGWDTKLTKHLTGPDPPRFGFLPISVKTPAKCPPKNAGIKSTGSPPSIQKWSYDHSFSKLDTQLSIPGSISARKCIVDKHAK